MFTFTNSIYSAPDRKNQFQFGVCPWTQSQVRIFYSKSDAYAAGFKHKTNWIAEGRKLCPDAEPSALLITPYTRTVTTRRGNRETITDPGVGVVRGLTKAEPAVLEDYGNGLFLVVTRCDSLYAREQTIPHVPKRKSVLNSNHTTPPNQYSTPLNRNEVGKIAVSAIPQHKLERKCEMKNAFREDTLVNSGKSCEVWCYLPENLSDEDMVMLGQNGCQLVGLLHLIRVIHALPKDAHIDLAWGFAEDMIPEWNRLRNKLLANGFLERTTVEEDPYGFGLCVERGVPGRRAYGYRLANPAYRHATFRRHELTDKRIVRNVTKQRNLKYSCERHLVKWLKQVTIDPVPETLIVGVAEAKWREDGTGTVQDRVESYKASIGRIIDLAWHYSIDDFGWRFHSNCTNLKSEFRRYLRLNGEPLVEIDIKNSQPLFLGIAAAADGVQNHDYLRCCEADLYQFLADEVGTTRQEAKRQLTQQSLFAPNGSPAQRLPVKVAFDRLFPEQADWQRERKAGTPTKENPKPYNKLAKIAQRAECRFMIRTVVDRIRKERPDVPLVTIHDSVSTTAEHANYVKTVLTDEFNRLGVNPRLEIKE